MALQTLYPKGEGMPCNAREAGFQTRLVTQSRGGNRVFAVRSGHRHRRGEETVDLSMHQHQLWPAGLSAKEGLPAHSSFNGGIHVFVG